MKEKTMGLSCSTVELAPLNWGLNPSVLRIRPILPEAPPEEGERGSPDLANPGFGWTYFEQTHPLIYDTLGRCRGLPARRRFTSPVQGSALSVCRVFFFQGQL